MSEVSEVVVGDGWRVACGGWWAVGSGQWVAAGPHAASQRMRRSSVLSWQRMGT